MPSSREPRDSPAAPRNLRQGRLLLAGTLALSALILVVVFGFTKRRIVYARSVSEVLAQPVREDTVRVNGYLVPGSLCQVPGRCEYRFRVSDAPPDSNPPQQELEVRYEGCVIPDTFRDVPGFELSVGVEGELCEGCSYLRAEAILAKCPAKYEIRYDAGWHEILQRPVPACQGTGSMPRRPSRR